MVATVAVYYNPAKTLGGMLEADMYCLAGLLFAAFVSLSSMTMFWFFEVRAGWEWLADALIILWIGIGMSLVAWMKLWMAKPTFNTACSMTTIILFVVVVKEGGIQTLLQVSFIILCGTTVANLVCILLWPQRATKNLQDAMTKTLQSFSTLLEMLTDTFLLEDSLRNLTSDKLQKAAQSHQASFTSLKKHFEEAQSEWLFGGPKKPRGDKTGSLHESSGQAYQDAIDCLNRLGQHLNGLRSGTTLQYELIRAEKDGKLVLKNHHPSTPSGTVPDSESSATVREDDDAAMLQAAAAMFGDLIDDLGPPLKALSTACITTLKRLKDGFTKRADPVNRITSAEFQQLADAVRRALFTFESTSNHAVVRLYRRQQNMPGTQSRDSYGSVLDENHVLTGNDGESVFLVYFFIFTLQEFSKELIALVDALERLYAAEHERASPRMSWKWLRDAVSISGPRSHARNKRNERSLSKRFSVYFNPGPLRDPIAFPKIRPHAPNTMQTPARSHLTYIGRLKQSLWAIGARMKEPDIKYAFKTGMATAMLAAPAFFDSTRPVFMHYRGEWALISFFVVISPTIGATNFMGIHRVLGTLLGAAIAAGIWTLFPENPYALSIFGFFFSIPCFYYIVAKPQYATSSRFVLLTYNLTCLYCYNLRRKDIDVLNIAYHRAVAVTVGVIWAAIVSRYWWPTEARRALSKALGEFCLNMGWLYTRLVAFNSFADAELRAMEEDADADDEESSPFVPRSRNAHLTNSIHDFMAMELHLQIKLIEIQGLLAQTQHEPRWKGPFPVALYRSILTSLQKILDQLHSMRCTVRRDFIVPVNRERREMVGNIILYFSTLSAAFALKSPLPPYLPPAEDARMRLVDAIRKLDVVRSRDVRGSRQLLFFAYALTMKGVIQELNFLGHTLQDVFGVIGQTREEFEALFNVTDTPNNV
ncbi:Fusaric acid resistance protein-like-domain-containing protein [Rhodofomes roseus]|uniref:Fusaric acid resistance protein-like-domain-containing protein n=1 Tax=Rhodofomes roseus TaxID=34475 RepID=A0ABQ8KLK2_9APHY|nr:Fusaric acid resistance protein-like-domain-containing protein [Rhodofomes roseus]KAH9839086.1 Fusaric acid resistance protein-like-domain-containing protein [Rhodofomes roseus]